MAAAVGKNEDDFVIPLHGSIWVLEVEKELSVMATQTWEEGVWVGKWSTEQVEAWMRQIFEVQTWRQVRGAAGAVMRETRDLGHKVAAMARFNL